MDEGIESKILRKVFLWMAAGGISIGAISGSGYYRADKFGESDAQVMKLEIQRDCREYIDLRFSAHQKVIPPTWTRARIRHIEEYLENKDPNFESVTEEW